MLLKLLFACVLVVITVSINGFEISALLHTIIKSDRWEKSTDVKSFPLLLIGLTLWLLFIHLVAISVWGLFYLWQGCLPDAPSAFYLSGVTYTTVGYGDLILPKPWQMLAPVQATTGILMCGLSTGLFFAIVSRRVSHWVKEKTSSEPKEPPEIDDR